MTKYGYPPAVSECEEAPAPPNLIVTANQQVLTPVAGTGMAPGGVGRKLSVLSIARQLNQYYANSMPVKVEVKGYGQFLIGHEGWELIQNG